MHYFPSNCNSPTKETAVNLGYPKFTARIAFGVADLIREERAGWNARRRRCSVDSREYMAVVEEGQTPIKLTGKWPAQIAESKIGSIVGKQGLSVIDSKRYSIRRAVRPRVRCRETR